jgi:hypothetical protein
MSQPDVAALAARLEPRVNALARQVVERQRAEVPGFGRLPSGVLDVEVAATARHGIRGFLRRAQGLDEADTDVFRQRPCSGPRRGYPWSRCCGPTTSVRRCCSTR